MWENGRQVAGADLGQSVRKLILAGSILFLSVCILLAVYLAQIWNQNIDSKASWLHSAHIFLIQEICSALCLLSEKAFFLIPDYFEQ